MNRSDPTSRLRQIAALDPEAWNELLATRRAREEWITPTMTAHWHSRYAGNLDTHRHFAAEWTGWQSLSGGPLHNVDLSHRDLDGADFSGASLTDMTMVKTGLRAANFSHSRLTHVNLAGALMLGAEFCDAVLEDVDFSGAYLYYCNFRGAQLINVRFDGARVCRITELSVRACQVPLNNPAISARGRR